MPEVPRGIIRNREHGTQVRDYSGLRFGNITATDVDGLIDYKGKGWLIFELKYGDSSPPYGQRLALERHCDDLQKSKPALLIVARFDTQGDILVHETDVVEFRCGGRWRRRQCKTGALARSFIRWLDGLYLVR